MVYLNCGANHLTALDVSSCPYLEQFTCGSNQLTELNLSNNSAVSTLSCSENPLSALDVSACRALEQLICSDCGLSELDVTQNTNLRLLRCTGNRLTELDFSHNPQIQFNAIHTEGSGYIGTDFSFSGMNIYHTACAEPMPGAAFVGWYNDDGELITEAEAISSSQGPANVIARFTEAAALPGDVNNDGFVNANDALMVMRAALGLAPAMGPEADVNGDGFVNANDALLILRVALGLASL